MKFGPLVYRNSGGIYADDPDTQAMQAKMERALAAQAARQIRKLINTHLWVIHTHGSCPHSMSLPVSFHVLDDAEVNAIKEQAALAERERIIRTIRSAV